MSDNINNKRYHKEIESEICLDEIMLNKNNFSKYQNSNNISHRNLKNINSNQVNILLNSLQDFCNRYEKDDRKILSNKKFIISFQEIISLIRESMLAQQQIDNLIYNNYDDKNNSNINIQKINQKYITDLGYNIFSFDKIDMGYGFNIKKKKKSYSNISPNNIKFQNNLKYKKRYNHQSISPNNIKKEINNIFENIYKEVFINGNPNPLNNIYRRNYGTTKSKNKNHRIERNKSAVINTAKNISPLKYHKVSSNKDNQRLNNTVINANISNNISYNNSKININNNYNSHFKGYNSFSANKNNFGNKSQIQNNKLRKNKNKDKLKSSDIYLACEKINKIKNSGNKNILTRSSNNYFNNNDNEILLKKSFKSVGIKDPYNNNNYTDIIGYEELRLNTGIKKIMVYNTHKPSTLANKLLISGQKYIEDFKEMNEGAKKKNI